MRTWRGWWHHSIRWPSSHSGQIDQLHLGHPGIRRMKNFITALFLLAQNGQRHRAGCTEMPLRYSGLPANKESSLPLAGCRGQEFIWTLQNQTKVKCFWSLQTAMSSWFIDAEWLNPAAVNVTVNYLRTIFRHFGAPETIVSDNGTQFTSTEFAKLCPEFVVEWFCRANGANYQENPW